MPEKRFIRRRNIAPDQGPVVSTQEQARLLNDPAVPIDNVHIPAESDHGQKRSDGARAESTQQPHQEFLEKQKAA